MTWYLMKSRSVTHDDMGTICDNKQYLTRMPNDTHAQVTELPFVYDTDAIISYDTKQTSHYSKQTKYFREKYNKSKRT